MSGIRREQIVTFGISDTSPDIGKLPRSYEIEGGATCIDLTFAQLLELAESAHSTIIRGRDENGHYGLAVVGDDYIDGY